MLVLLDTTVLIDYLRGRPAVRRVQALRDRGDVPVTAAVNVEEVIRGLRDGEEDAAAGLFAGLVVLPVRRAEALLAGRWRREHAVRGITLSQADCLIGAAAAVGGARLVTGNPVHFPMAELAVEAWPVGT